MTLTTQTPKTGTCPECGTHDIPICNWQPSTKTLGEQGYLSRHHRVGTRAGTRCRGSFGNWVGKVVKPAKQ